MPTIAEQLGAYAEHELTAPLSDEVRHHTRRAMIDWFAALLPGDPALASLTFEAPTPITATRQGLPDASPGTFETITLRSSVLRQDHSGPPPSDAPVPPLRELRPIR